MPWHRGAPDVSPPVETQRSDPDFIPRLLCELGKSVNLSQLQFLSEMKRMLPSVWSYLVWGRMPYTLSLVHDK